MSLVTKMFKIGYTVFYKQEKPAYISKYDLMQEAVSRGIKVSESQSFDYVNFALPETDEELLAMANGRMPSLWNIGLAAAYLGEKASRSTVEAALNNAGWWPLEGTGLTQNEWQTMTTVEKINRIKKGVNHQIDGEKLAHLFSHCATFEELEAICYSSLGLHNISKRLVVKYAQQMARTSWGMRTLSAYGLQTKEHAKTYFNEHFRIDAIRPEFYTLKMLKVALSVSRNDMKYIPKDMLNTREFWCNLSYLLKSLSKPCRKELLRYVPKKYKKFVQGPMPSLEDAQRYRKRLEENKFTYAYQRERIEEALSFEPDED